MGTCISRGFAHQPSAQDLDLATCEPELTRYEGAEVR